VETFLEAIKLINKDKINLIHNDSIYATYNSFPTKADVKNFKAKGYRLR
jgi:hypothetical protein